MCCNFLWETLNLFYQGKTVKTKEENGLEENLMRFRKQEEEVKNLDGAFQEYLTALDTVKTAEMKLMGTWAENIADWQNLENFQMNAETIRNRRTENIETLEKDVIIPMMTYREQFSEIKRRIDKCEEKKMEYDRCSFQLQQIETAAGHSQAGLERARAKVDRSRDAYHSLVEELSSVLPHLYQARRELYATNLQTLFSLQKYFHSDLSFTFRDMSEYVLIKLKND